MRSIITIYLIITTSSIYGIENCESRFNILAKEKHDLIIKKFPEFTQKAVSLANQIEKDNFWKTNGTYSITKSGKYKAVFLDSKRSLVYFASGNAFIEAYLKIENDKKHYWCSND